MHGIAGARAGDQVAIEIRNIGWVEGVVVWAQDALAGLSFDKPIDPSALRGKITPPSQPSNTTRADPDVGSHPAHLSSPDSEEFYVVRWMRGATVVSETHFDNLTDAKAHAKNRLQIQRIRKGITAVEVCDIEGVTYFVAE